MGNPYEPAMGDFIDMELKIAEALYGKVSSFADFVKKSSMSQADVLTAEIDFARANGRCGGLMSWMYNDIWPTGTWSVVDYYLTEKPGYYAMKRAFEPVRLTFVRSAAGTRLALINDGVKNFKGKVVWGVKTMKGEVKERFETDAAISVGEIFKQKIADLKVPSDCYLFAEADGLKAVLDVNRYERQRLKSKPTLAVVRTGKSGGGYYADLMIESPSYTEAVKIDLNGVEARFSDNYFDLGAGERANVRVTASAPIRTQDLTIQTFADEWED